MKYGFYISEGSFPWNAISTEISLHHNEALPAKKWVLFLHFNGQFLGDLAFFPGFYEFPPNNWILHRLQGTAVATAAFKNMTLLKHKKPLHLLVFP